MVSELHRSGYQNLRILPYEHPLAWRLVVGPKLALPPQGDTLLEEWPTYTSASSARYFDWSDAQHDSARQLATKFISRFPAVCADGLGRDWEYAGWLLELLGVIETERALPVYFNEHGAVLSYADLTLRRCDGSEQTFPLPPLCRVRVEK